MTNKRIIETARVAVRSAVAASPSVVRPSFGGPLPLIAAPLAPVTAG